MSPTQTSPGPAGRERLDVGRVLAPVRDADGLARGRVDHEDAAGVAGVVGGDEEAVLTDQPAGLDDLRVLEGEDDRRRAVAGRGVTATRAANGAATSADQQRSGIEQLGEPRAAGPRSSTSSSYSWRSEPPLTGAPVRTARSMVLRGVCLLSTNCTTSTR